MNKPLPRIARAAVPAAALASAAAANAAAIDVTELASDIASQGAPVGVVGVAVLLIYGAVKAFKWVRSALS